MIVAVQKTPLRADRLKATPPRTREGVAPRMLLRRSVYVISNSNSSGHVVMACHRDFGPPGILVRGTIYSEIVR